jgi:hypothetical protein
MSDFFINSNNIFENIFKVLKILIKIVKLKYS